MRKIGKSNKRGFTLLELVIIIVIAVIFLAIIIPPMAQALSNANDYWNYYS
ncbi:MAG: prepilin-type N-terminal cleavage/methylation domain-containing protein [Clostridiales bacterium]|nr:prepilin-type N-terminal cleavage/methylation domain-containing protein [Clostridiales bacterium]